MTVALMKPYTDKIHTITGDNGREFSYHEAISQKLNCKFYFAHPYCSWERGLNENRNGLIRQYAPKGSSFESINEEKCQFIMDRLNNRPRETLGGKTPNQVFFGDNFPINYF